MGTLISGLDGIAYVQLISRIGALKLEIKGLSRHGRSAYAICKEVYGLKGSKAKVLAQLEVMKEQALEAREAANWNPLTLTTAAETDIANEYRMDYTHEFVVGDTVLHNHIIGRYARMRQGVN